eukprot:CAMPEP_0202021836 /NCGR_PEP_ID=MMETSP0905-20130828/47921_1 /ASSEMBLY_ACC=CAM_ASM_000554 /TAXON_ID=420261 /ORGANISM="Thalassiosira antarctica, Strain CCMP982" /LENGTH=180 /DNA_ID=CAMNT_0048583823 /DNA_START=54 /DNA_END=599 /DNA_ORIENTATION=-
MTLADMTTQLLVEKRLFFANDQTPNPKQQVAAVQETTYDPIRTLRWATVGLTLHGPYFLLSFGKLDRLMLGGGGTTNSLLVVAKKTAIAQLVIFPPYLVALFTYMGVMEQGSGSNANKIMARVQDRVPEAFMSGCVFWPFANCINFALVPASARVPYLASVGGLWNGYLSYMNAKRGEDG